jgi:chitinase
VVDEQACAAYCVGGDGGFVSYDVPATVTAKAEFVRAFRLGGLFYKSGTEDRVDADEEGSLVMAGYCALHP